MFKFARACAIVHRWANRWRFIFLGGNPGQIGGLQGDATRLTLARVRAFMHPVRAQLNTVAMVA